MKSDSRREAREKMLSSNSSVRKKEGIRYQPGDAPTRVAAPPVGGIGIPGRGVGASGGASSGAGRLGAGAVGASARAGTPGKPTRPARRIATASHLTMVIASRQPYITFRPEYTTHFQAPARGRPPEPPEHETAQPRVQRQGGEVVGRSGLYARRTLRALSGAGGRLTTCGEDRRPGTGGVRSFTALSSATPAAVAGPPPCRRRPGVSGPPHRGTSSRP